MSVVMKALSGLLLAAPGEAEQAAEHGRCGYPGRHLAGVLGEPQLR